MNEDPGPAGSPRTLGPVADLEDHVPADWWRTLFGPTYLMTDGDVLDEACTRDEADRILQSLHLNRTDRVLDLCCGQGRHALELARRGYTHVEGIDASAYLIGEARAAARHEGLTVAFTEGDCRALPHAAGSFDVVLILGNSFGFFEASQDDHAVLREVRRVLRPGGRLLLDLTCGDHMRLHYEPRSWEWIDAKHFVCRERTLSKDRLRLIAREVITHVEQGVLVDQFYAERLYGRDELKRLLAAAGFDAVDVSGTITRDAAEHPDLGMMGHRMLVTARKRFDAVVLGGDGQAPPAARQVVVVMGDPRLPDAAKVGGRFDEDDFEVIDRLKEALAALPGYRFTYLDDHSQLWTDLQHVRGSVDFVLNLCDEGFGNEARQELHLPAMLEVLGLPYSGAGPQALAHCYDKSLVRGVAREMDVPVPKACLVRPGIPTPAPGVFPVIVKPNSGDNSRGIARQSVARTAEELEAALAYVRAETGGNSILLVEEFLTGKDLTLGIIGNAEGGYMVLPITEDDYTALPPELPRLCGFEAKWLPDSPYWQGIRTVPADLPEAVRTQMEACSIAMFERLGCRDYARFDWRLGADGLPRLLEVNPNPGWCWDSHLVKQAAFAGYDYAGVLGLILEAAAQRIGREQTPPLPVLSLPNTDAAAS